MGQNQNNSISMGVAILAAGEGKRIKIPEAKALLPLLGKRMIDYPMMAAREFCARENLDCHIGVVVGHLKERVQDYITQTNEQRGSTQDQLQFAVQARPLGTADAVKSYFASLPHLKKTDFTLVMCADVPLIQAEDLQKLFHHFQQQPHLQAVAATFQVENPFGYGRIIRQGGKNEESGFHIVEEKHTNEVTAKINEVNSSLYLVRTPFLLQSLNTIEQNSLTQEFYLTDIFQDHLAVRPVLFSSSEHFLGVNTLEQLEQVTKILLRKKVQQLSAQGVRFLDSQQVYLDWEVEVASQAVIYPNTFLEGKTKIGKGVMIEPGVIVKNSTIGEGTLLKAYSYLEDVTIGTQVDIGPFARLRPGTEIEKKAKVGNFVEIKKSKLAAGVKVSHLSYVGDAEIGEESNLGCGFITCNYDGVKKHRTKIGKKTFVGSDCQMVAPIEIGDQCFVAAGSTVTQNMPDGSFAIARSRQVTKEGVGKKFLKQKD